MVENTNWPPSPKLAEIQIWNPIRLELPPQTKLSKRANTSNKQTKCNRIIYIVM